MNNYDVPCGGIIYPGPQLKITVDKKNRQVMAWIPFTWTEKAFEVAPNYFAFISDRMATVYSRIEEEDLEKFVEEVERNAFEFYEAIATPGAVPPEMPEFLYNEEVELDLEEIIELEGEEEEISSEEILEDIVEASTDEKRQQLASDIASGNVASGEGGDGNYAISKDISEEDEPEVDIAEISTSPTAVEDFSSDTTSVEEIEEYKQPTDSIPDRKVSVSIDQLRKKMVKDSEN